MAKIIIDINRIDNELELSDEFHLENKGANVNQVMGAIGMLARYLTDRTDLTVPDIIKVIGSSTGLEKIE